MPLQTTSPPNELSRSFSQMTDSLWFGWSPSRVGVLSLLALALPMLVTIWNMYRRADLISRESIQNQLLSAARSIAQQVDPELHGTFQSPDQEQSKSYVKQIQSMAALKAALDTYGVLKFAYTCIESGGQIRFVLDTTPAGDADQDGKDDKSHIMERYEHSSATLRKTLQTGFSAVDVVPYQDRWGTFMSAYAPIFNASHQVIGVAGVDMSLTDYEQQREGVRQMAIISAVGAVCLAFMGSLAVAAYHRRLQRSIDTLVAAGDEVMSAARAKSDFLAAMSHELRTPMNAVIGTTEMLSETQLDSQQRSFVNTVQRSSESLLNMITDVLDFSQMDAGHIAVTRVPMSPRKMLGDLQAHVLPAVEAKKLSLILEIDSSCPERVLGDPEHLRQVMRHLIMNAIKFTDAGSITISLTQETLRMGDQGLHFVVRDTGIGIADEQQQRLFQPFVQLDGSTTRRHGGTGIGLAICRRLCDAMDGQLWVESELGEGSAFHALIPAEVVSEHAGVNLPSEALIWIHDSMTQMLASRVIQKQGHRVRVVTSFDELEQARHQPSVRWALVESALVAAEHLNVFKELTRTGKRVIVLNGDAGKNYHEVFHAVLSQPVRPADLRKALES